MEQVASGLKGRPKPWAAGSHSLSPHVHSSPHPTAQDSVGKRLRLPERALHVSVCVTLGK